LTPKLSKKAAAAVRFASKPDQDPSLLTDARIPKGALAAFIELHIEQGPHLDEAKSPSGSYDVQLRRIPPCRPSSVTPRSPSALPPWTCPAKRGRTP